MSLKAVAYWYELEKNRSHNNAKDVNTAFRVLALTTEYKDIIGRVEYSTKIIRAELLEELANYNPESDIDEVVSQVDITKMFHDSPMFDSVFSSVNEKITQIEPLVFASNASASDLFIMVSVEERSEATFTKTRKLRLSGKDNPPHDVEATYRAVELWEDCLGTTIQKTQLLSLKIDGVDLNECTFLGEGERTNLVDWIDQNDMIWHDGEGEFALMIDAAFASKSNKPKGKTTVHNTELAAA